MYYTYVIENKKGWRYIGSSGDIAKRLSRHNSNSVRSTKNRGPFKIVFKEEFSTRTEARKRENQLKSYKGNKAFTRLLKDSASLSSSLV